MSTAPELLSGFVPWSIPDPRPALAGSLGGLRLAVKDVIDVAGMPTGAGHPRWLETHPVPENDADVVAALRAAGATIVGKTHTDELAFSLMGTNAHYGTPVNPAAPGHLPGGSSSGSAVAVAGGHADLGLGTDTAGSIRVPASWCGLYGLRPSHSRVSRRGVVPLGPMFDAPSLLTRDLATLAAGASALLDGAATGAPTGLIIAPELWALVPPEVRATFAPALTKLRNMLPYSDTQLLGPDSDHVAVFTAAQGVNVWEEHGAWITEQDPGFGPHVTARIRAAAASDPADRAPRRTRAAAVRQAIRDALGDRVAVFPSTPEPALPRGTSTDPAARQNILALTTLAPLGGLPAVSLPLGTVDGRPIGLSLLGPDGSDEQLLALAATLLP